MYKDIKIINEMKELEEKFLKIKNNGVWKSMRKGTGGMGYTFEYLIDKKEDFNFLPDYKGIEIKTKHCNSKEPLALFSMAPKREDGIIYSKYLINNFGKDNDFCNKKFIGAVYYKIFHKTLNGFKIKTKLDLNSNKLKLLIFDEKYNLIDSATYWNLDELKKRLFIKLNYMAFISGSSCFINNQIYYKYSDLDFYKIKSFDEFLNLLTKSKIHITFNINTTIDKKSNSIKIIDKGTTFRLKIDSINDLFNKIKLDNQ